MMGEKKSGVRRSTMPLPQNLASTGTIDSSWRKVGEVLLNQGSVAKFGEISG